MWHRNVTSVVHVVPINGKYTKEGAGTINGYGVELLQELNKVLSVLLSNVLNSKSFDNKREGDVFAGVFSERGSACHWGVSEFGNV